MQVEPGIFKAYDIRGVYPAQLDEQVARAVGQAFVTFLEVEEVVVGRDMRLSGPGMHGALIGGLTEQGADVIDIGMVSTDQYYYACATLERPGIMVTASHNPPAYNGFKFSGPGASAVGSDSGLFEIRDAVLADPQIPDEQTGGLEEVDLIGAYREQVLQFVRGLRPLKVAIDACNGMDGKMVPAIFGELPIEIRKLNFTHDGRFAHDPNPMKAENTADLQAMVREGGVDFGACFDGDADRCVLIDETGERIPSDLITALLATEALRAEPGAAIVYDLRSSRAVREAIVAGGGVPIRERVGHAFMKAALKKHNAVLGGELSGHYYFRENGFADSGMILFAMMLTVLSATEKRISELVAPLEKYHATGELNFRVSDKTAAMGQVTEHFADGEVDELDGVTVQFNDWWLNLRPSNTEPLLRLNLEADTAALRDAKLAEVTALLGEPGAQ